MYILPTEDARRQYVPGIESNHVVMSPVVENQKITLRANAFILQNAGNCDVLLDNGYTLFPRQTYMVGVYGSLDVVKIDGNIRFLPATSTARTVIQRLEIVQITTAVKGRGYYIDQPIS